MEHFEAELSIHDFLEKCSKGERSMSIENIDLITEDIKKSLIKQFQQTKKEEFKLRMSNIGRPTCQLWYEKNKPEVAEGFPSYFVLNMLLGDLIEAVFKGVMREAKVDFKDSDKVSLKLKDHEVQGEYDLTMNNVVDDIKSASPWSFNNKFNSFDSLNNKDGFGYVSQLVGYAKALNVEPGGWWVINKASGDFKYVQAEGVDTEAVMNNIKTTVDYITNDKPFIKCFEDVPETYRGVPSGNYILPKECTFCRFKKDCWDNLQELPSKVSKAKELPIVYYTKVAEENEQNNKTQSSEI
tara:strand:- start:2835 stop:3725 length:891 start_codon:yes stop_codon:yes gene_type:complete